jgi:hypothetical protein
LKVKSRCNNSFVQCPWMYRLSLHLVLINFLANQ